jgi:chromosome segregation ATPase
MPTTLTPFAGIPSEEKQEELSKTENVEHCRQNSEATSVKQLDLPDDSKLVQIEEEEIQLLRSELEQTKHILTVRESKLLELSQMNVALSEENDTLKSELAFAPAKQNEEEGGIEDLKDEFARRIASVEKKLHQSLKDKEVLRKELQTLKTEKDAIGSKDEEIASLRAEGEKLSKQQLQSSETIKKLRKKEQENQKLISNLKKSADTAEEEISRLKEALQRREDNERKLQENLAKLNSFAEQQSFELSTVKGERDELSDKSRSLQTNLDNVYKEMSELKKANAASENAVKEATLSAELSAKEELKSLLEQTRRDYQQEKDMLSLQIADLRAGMSRAEQQASWREDQLRQELAALQSVSHFVLSCSVGIYTFST